MYLADAANVDPFVIAQPDPSVGNDAASRPVKPIAALQSLSIGKSVKMPRSVSSNMCGYTGFRRLTSRWIE